MSKSGEFKVEQTHTVFYIRLPNGSKAYLSYDVSGNIMRLIETYTPPEYRGMGLAKMMVERATQVAEERNLKIEPICSYSVYYFLKNPEKRKLLADKYRSMTDSELEAYYKQRLESEKSKSA